MILLLDSLALLYRSYYAIPNLSTPKGKPIGAVYGLLNTTTHLIESLQPNSIIACFDRPETTVRAEICDTYKATREVPDDDLIEQIEEAKILLPKLHITVLEKAGYEADDIIGSLAKKIKDEVVIVTCDNDLLQLADDKLVRVYLLSRGTKEFISMGAQEVQEKYGFKPNLIPDYKGLLGDASDNISGVQGIGMVTAKKLISTFGDLDTIYKKITDNTLSKEGIAQRTITLLLENKNDAFQSRELATIHTDLDFSIPHQDTKKWIERVTIEDIQITLQKYNFKSLIKRYQKILPPTKKVEKNITNESSTFINETGVALWVLDSDKINPSIDEILTYTNTTTISEAYKKIVAELRKKNRLSVWENIEKPLISILKTMEEIGVHMNKKSLLLLEKEFQKEIAKIEKEIHIIAGKTFNLNSPKQTSEVIFNDMNLQPKRKSKTSTGQRSTKESVLIDMKKEHPIIELILQHRHLRKLLSSYVVVFIELLDSKNRLHTTFMQTGTTTGRLASRNPNLQNIPTATLEGKKIKQLFVATPGWKILTADYSQFELRILAILSKEEALLDSFKRGEDVHTTVAARMFHIPHNSVTQEQRRKAKVVNFGIVYGMGSAGVSRAIEGVSTKQAKQFLEEYHTAFPKLTAYLDVIKKDAREKGFVQTAFGRSRTIYGSNSSLSFVRAQADRMAMNAPIQGTAADIIKLAMIAINTKLQKQNNVLHNKLRMLLQIHDELFFEVQPSVLHQAIELIGSEMENIYPPQKNPIPLLVEIKVGEMWGLLKRVTATKNGTIQ